METVRICRMWQSFFPFKIRRGPFLLNDYPRNACSAASKTGIAADDRPLLPLLIPDAEKAPPERSRQRNNILDMLSGIRKRWKRNMCFLRNNA